jgi:hypothetical protein
MLVDLIGRQAFFLGRELQVAGDRGVARINSLPGRGIVAGQKKPPAGAGG